MTVTGYENTTLIELPELESFDPAFGSTTATEDTTEIKFNFHSEEVFPAESTNGYGLLRIYRGAIKSDGTIDVASQAPVLWEDTTLNDTSAPDKFKQGDIECSLSGDCLIHLSGTSRLKAGEIYFLTFYGYSFKNENGYYLFGPGATVGQALYEHMFQCRSFNITSSDQLLNGNYVEVQGTGLLYNEADVRSDGNDIVNAKFTTIALKLKLRITNSTTCSDDTIPSASVHTHDITDTQFVIRNLDLQNCYQGDLYADAILVRGIKESSGVWTHVRKEYLDDIKIGTIGCDSSCRHCSGTGANQCILCSNTAQYIYDGTCVDACPTDKPYKQTASILFNSSVVTYTYCTDKCELSEYSDETNTCTSCNNDCLTCTSNAARSCTYCKDFKFLFNGICLSSCPTPFYTEEYMNYSCVSTNTSSTVSLNIQNIGYETKVQKDIQAYFRAEIDNTDTSTTISSIKWTQIDPTPATDSVTLFPKDTHGVIIDNTAEIKVKMSSFNYISSSQSIKIQCVVTNSAGQTAVDITEFYLNDSPFEVNTVFTSTGGTNSKEAMVTDFGYDTSQWYDSIDDSSQQLTFRTYFTFHKINYMISDFTSTNNVTFKLPYFSKVAGSTATIDLCVEAIDKYEAASSSCNELVDAVSNYAGTFSTLISPFTTLNMSDHTNILTFVNYLNFLIGRYELNEIVGDYPSSAAASYICKMDFH